MRTRSRRWLVVACVAVAAVQLGAPCDQPPPPAMSNTVRLDTPAIVVVNPSYYTGSADVIVEVDDLVQAVELEVSWDPAAIALVSVVHHADFDDDGTLALPIQVDAQAGVATGIVDLRHGAAAQGPVRVATVHFEAPTGAPGTLSVSGEVADPTGALCITTPGPPISTP